jgi:hypothetical protein
MATLQTIVEEYRKNKGYANQEPFQRLIAAVGDLAAADAHRGTRGWARENGQPQTITGAVGNVLMTLCEYCEREGIDPVGAMLDEMQVHGFDARARGLTETEEEGMNGLLAE